MEPHIIALIVIFAIALSLIVSICMIRKHKKEELLRIERQRQWEAGREERERRAKEEAERKALEQRLAKERYEKMVEEFLIHPFTDKAVMMFVIGYNSRIDGLDLFGKYRASTQFCIMSGFKNGKCEKIVRGNGAIMDENGCLSSSKILMTMISFANEQLPPIKDYDMMRALLKAVSIKIKERMEEIYKRRFEEEGDISIIIRLKELQGTSYKSTIYYGDEPAVATVFDVDIKRNVRQW